VGQEIEAPLQRVLRVGKVTVGILGIDVALSKYGCDKTLAVQEAVAVVFKDVLANNYVPATAAHLYRQAIEDEIVRLRSGGKIKNSQLVIRILGPGCVSCNKLQSMVLEIMNELGVAADIFQVHDLDEIGRFGIVQTPALVINGDLKSAGRHPSPSQIEAWLREYID
jgi:small redox-active disulfide protein 2